MRYSALFSELFGCSNAQEVFSYLLGSLIDSITYWDYFVNWNKATHNVHQWELDLNALNILVGKQDVEQVFGLLLRERPSVLALVPVLLACREKQFNILVDFSSGTFRHEQFDFRPKDRLSDSEIAKAVQFAASSGLLDIFKTKNIRSVPDYVLGVQVGLDSNARKNRHGQTMESLVEKLVQPMCQRLGIEYLRQANADRIECVLGIRPTSDKTDRRYDFALARNRVLYLIETNYYGGGGSKLKATAGEYRTLATVVQSPSVRFIWVTDGTGWRTTEASLRDAFDAVDYTLNLTMLSHHALDRIVAGTL